VSSGLKLLLVDHNKFVGEIGQEFCAIPMLIADCGNPKEGCPDCISDTQEVACPCCNVCCYDHAEEDCNGQDWLQDITMDWVDVYSRSDYIVTDETDLEPVH
jgi:hypothetical protein